MIPVRKLESLAARFSEIEEALCQPEVASDQKRYMRLTRERADLQQIVEKYNEYKRVQTDLEGHKDAMRDPELRELAAQQQQKAAANAAKQ